MRDQAAAKGVDLVVFSELVLVGYPPRILSCDQRSWRQQRPRCTSWSTESAAGGPGLLVTLPWRDARSPVAKRDRARRRRHRRARFKYELPNYGVFDEKRLFVAGDLPEPVTFRGVRIGVPICEDIWLPHVTEHLTRRGAELFIVPNGSPFEVDKFHQRIERPDSGSPNQDGR
jgi:NAD+ synthase